MPIRRSTRAVLLAMACGGVAAGCGGGSPLPVPAQAPRCELPEQLVMEIVPDQRLNYDRDGLPRSLQLKLYQLKRDAELKEAGFEELWHGDDRTLLADSLVSGPEVRTAVPGRTERWAWERHPEARLVAVLGHFREYHPGGAWKQTVALPAPLNPCADSHDGESAPQALVRVRLVNYAISATVRTTRRRRGG